MGRFLFLRWVTIGLGVLWVPFACFSVFRWDPPVPLWVAVVHVGSWVILVLGFVAGWLCRREKRYLEEHGWVEAGVTAQEKRLEPEEFQAILNEAAALLLEAVKEEIGEKSWVRAVDDRRWFPDGSFIGKTRIHLEKEGVIHSLHFPRESKRLVDRLWEGQAGLFADKWYGLNLIVYPDGKCETVFNYDPNCGNDPTFFDMVCQ